MLSQSRRDFLAAIGGLAASASILQSTKAFAAASKSPKALPIGFSTLGCPTWPWLQILDFAKQHHYTGVELRMLLGNVDLPSCPELMPARIQQSKREIEERGLHISCVDTSSYLNEPDPAKLEAQMVDARRFIDLASELHSPYIRVTGNEYAGTVDESIARVAKGLRQLGDYAGPKNVTVLIESHGDFVHGKTLLEVFRQADSPHVALLWDAHNSYVVGHEDPEITVSAVGSYVRHVHLKDASGTGDQRHYVLTGKGDVPVKRQVQLLVDIGYTGYFSYEWEKAWHPDILDPSIALPNFSEVMTEYLHDAYAHRHARPPA